MGDLNARVGLLKDYFVSDEFLAHLNNCDNIFQPDVVELSLVYKRCRAPLERTVQDTIVNNFGYKMIELCKNLDMLIVKSRIGSDKHIGCVTCKNSSIVD